MVFGDIYTEYMTKEEYEELAQNIQGDYVGIGIYMGQDRSKNVVVLTPIKGSPAEESGLKTGDIITKVDGEDSQGKDLTIVSNRIKGEAGTKVELEISRDGEVFTKTIERRKVILNPIESEVLEGNIRIYKTNII